VSVIAIVPARKGSKGIPGKNFRMLGGTALWLHAARCAERAGADQILVSTDREYNAFVYERFGLIDHPERGVWIERPANLAADTTPMFAVVQHALSQIEGQSDDIIVLLQPTQPFRTPAHVREAIWLLQETQADSVVSVVPLPLSHSPDMLGVITGSGRLQPWNDIEWPPTRQRVTPAVMRDGTCYVCWRKTIEQHGSIYGPDVRPLLIDPADSCELDTELDWAACVRRWEETHDRG
jgi:CMP-N,N'-diacetyllegionaminic acid synthase